VYNGLLCLQRTGVRRNDCISARWITIRTTCATSRTGTTTLSVRRCCVPGTGRAAWAPARATPVVRWRVSAATGRTGRWKASSAGRAEGAPVHITRPSSLESAATSTGSRKWWSATTRITTITNTTGTTDDVSAVLRDSDEDDARRSRSCSSCRLLYYIWSLFDIDRQIYSIQ